MQTRLRGKFLLLFVAFAVMLAVPGIAMALTQGTPTIQSDKADYAPGETVTLTGANWVPGDTIHIVVDDATNHTWQHTADVTADSNGGIQDVFTLPTSFVSDYSVTATDTTNGTDSVTSSFTDGNVTVKLAGGPTSATISWEKYNSNTNCSGAPNSSGSTAANNTSSTAVTGAGNGQSVKLTAPTLSGYTFSAWSAGSASGNTTCVQGGSGDIPATATYAVAAPSDTTPPVITKQITGTSGDNGWYTSDVSVKWTVSDPDSAVVIDSGCGTQNFTSSTASVTSSCSAHSAGGSASDSVTLKIDKEAPDVSVTASRVPDSNGWYNHAVGFSASGSNYGPSGAGSCDADKSYSGPDSASASVSMNCTDGAGNSGSGSASFKYDNTAPSVTVSLARAADQNGWYNHAVGYGVSAKSDLTSGIASCQADDTYSGPDSANASVSRTCTDNAGNIGSDSKSFQYDATAPTLNPTVSPNPVLLNGGATASANAQDNLSGVASANCDPVDTSSVGSHSVSCSATDNAGNTNSANANYSVNYKFVGFSAPVDNNNVLNSAKAGQAIPLKWQLLDANNIPITNLSSVKVTATSLSCSLGTTTDQLEEYAAGSSGLQNLGGGYYQFNWKSPTTYASSCKTLNVDMGEGPHTALFKFTK